MNNSHHYVDGVVYSDDVSDVRSEPQVQIIVYTHLLRTMKHLTEQIGSMVSEFDKLQKLNRRRIDEARQVEQTFHQLCQKFHVEKNEWKNEQIRFYNNYWCYILATCDL